MIGIASLFQQKHLSRKLLPAKCNSKEVGPASQTRCIEEDLMIHPRLPFFVDQVRHLVPGYIVHFQEHMPILGEGKFNGGGGIERIRVVLPECEFLWRQ